MAWVKLGRATLGRPHNFRSSFLCHGWGHPQKSFPSRPLASPGTGAAKPLREVGPLQRPQTQTWLGLHPTWAWKETTQVLASSALWTSFDCLGASWVEGIIFGLGARRSGLGANRERALLQRPPPSSMHRSQAPPSSQGFFPPHTRRACWIKCGGCIWPGQISSLPS